MNKQVVLCPVCDSDEFYCVQKVDEYYDIKTISAEGRIERSTQQDSTELEDERLVCITCDAEMTAAKYVELVKQKELEATC